jgi:hypothetical protein
MDQLLHRMRREESEDTDPAIVPLKRTAGSVADTERGEKTSPPTDAASQPDRSQQPNAPRSPQPAADLSAMRELANLSTQEALETHSRSVLMNEIYVKSTITLTAVLFGAVLVCGTAQFGSIALLAGLGCLLGGAVLGARLPRLIADYIRAGKATDDDALEEEANDADHFESTK